MLNATDSYTETAKIKDGRIRKGVMNPRDPMENGTIGGTGPLNIDAACNH